MHPIANLFSVKNSGLFRRIFCTSFVGSLLKSIQSIKCLPLSSRGATGFAYCALDYGRGLHTSAVFRQSIHENPRNQQIKAKTILLIGSNGENLGKMTLQAAQNKAKEDSLQLVQIQSQKGTSPAICKLFSSRTLYESEKKAKANTQGSSKTKELKITGRIAPQDLVWKSKKIRDFLEQGYFVKLSVTRKPYQKISVAEKLEIVSQIKEEVKDVGMLDGDPKEIGALALKCNFKPTVQKDKSKA